MTNKFRFLIVTGLLVAGLMFAGSGALAKDNTNKPGWGFGDDNHVHTGPPGLSVRPQPLRPLHLEHWFFDFFHRFFHWD